MYLLDITRTDPRIFLDTEDNKEKILCAVCKSEITEQKYLFSPGEEGTTHTFTNPGGFLFHLLTFSRCRNYQESSLPETENTWFPPYAWVIIRCASCDRLLGWKFVHPDQSPPEFYGLIRESILLSE